MKFKNIIQDVIIFSIGTIVGGVIIWTGLNISFTDSMIKSKHFEIISLINQLNSVENGDLNKLKIQIENSLNVKILYLGEYVDGKSKSALIAKESIKMVAERRKIKPFLSNSELINKDIEGVFRKIESQIK